MSGAPRKVAVLFRYGAAEHVDFLPALPELVKRLADRNCEVHHFGFGRRGKRSAPINGLKERHGPLRVNRAGRVDKWLKAALWLAWLPFLGKRLQKEGFDRVFVDETLPLSASLLRLGYKGWLAFTVHDFFVELYWMPHPLLRPIGRCVQRADLKAWSRLDHLFTRVEAAKRFLTERGIPGDRITVAPDSVDTRVFHPPDDGTERKRVRKKWRLGEGDLVMIHHGVLHPNKGNGRLVEGLFRMRYRLPNLKLVIIGDGPERLEVDRLRHTLGIEDRVALTGWLPGLEDIAELLRAADIGLVMRKGMPGDDFHVTSTLVHNLASGLPVLAARLEGVAEAVGEGTHGLLFDPECGREFDQKLETLARDEGMRKRMGQAARQLAEERFDPHHIAGVYARVLVGE